ncbi:hypothetical protein BN946_scf185037.g2 [Trametes cinnabarina]|uniref:Uncharacterized protein n=1 Tax=Pycnoporus cinnabarinus TaxID=5643 RepID=A0A060SVD1_PYCCI|nr:hypothetical protein BN946_scf185037.g2 [Trametes cinnabarina]
MSSSNRLPVLPPLPNTRIFNFPTPVTPPAPSPLSTPSHGHVPQYGSSPASPSSSNHFLSSAAAQQSTLGAINAQAHGHQQQPQQPPLPALSGASFAPLDNLGWETSATGDTSTPEATNSVAVASHSSVLPQKFIDNLSNDLNLLEAQNDQMHLFVDLGSVQPALSPADLAPRLYILGAIFALGAEQKRAAVEAAKSVQNLPALFTDLKIRLENTFVFTSQQRDNIRAIVQDHIFQPNRTEFKTMFTDIEIILEKDQEKMALQNVYGNPWRMKQLTTLIKGTCSGVRNHYRREICESIDETGKKKCSLSEFTYRTAMKYKLGGAGTQLDPTYSVHIALLRRFAIDHPLLRGAAEKEDAVDDDGVAGEDGSVSHTTAEDPEGGPPLKKQKASRATGKRPSKGDDFWSQVDAWFAEKVAAMGPRLMAPSWRGLIDNIVQQDEIDYPNDSGTLALVTIPGHSVLPEGQGRSSAAANAANAGGLSARPTPRRMGAHLLNLLN